MKRFFSLLLVLLMLCLAGCGAKGSKADNKTSDSKKTNAG